MDSTWLGTRARDARSRRLDPRARSREAREAFAARSRARASPRACPPLAASRASRSNASATRLRVFAMLPLQHINPIADDRVRSRVHRVRVRLRPPFTVVVVVVVVVFSASPVFGFGFAVPSRGNCRLVTSY